MFSPQGGLAAQCRTHNKALHGLQGTSEITLDLSRYPQAVRTRASNQIDCRVRTTDAYSSLSGGLIRLMEYLYAFNLPLNLARGNRQVLVPREHLQEAKDLVHLMNMECAAVATVGEAKNCNGVWFYMTGSQLGVHDRPSRYNEKLFFSRLGPLMRKCCADHVNERADQAVVALTKAITVQTTANLEFTK